MKINNVPSSKKLHIFLFLFLCITAPLSILVNLHVQKSQEFASNSTPNTFTPIVIPPSSSEIGNPGRGPEYYGGESPPPNWPITDVYTRPCWRSLEPTQGNYDFSLIEQTLAKAKQQGGMGGFRIMTLNISGGGGTCVPDYMKTLMPKGFYINNNHDYVPDWNDPNYISRFTALFQALAQKYANDPRLGWIDLSGYGCWSEWHTYCDNNNNIPYPVSSGAIDATQTTLKTIIDAQTQAFPNTRFLTLTANSYAMNYALNLQRILQTGERRDCLGVESLTYTPSTLWMKAPLYGEYCSGANFQKGLTDVTSTHISMIGDGDGNLNSFNSYSQSDQNLIIETYKISGYRFILDSLTIPSQIGQGGGFSVISKWSNVNIAPAYLPWSVMIQLRNTTGTIAWQGTSNINLDNLLPTVTNGIDTPIVVTDNFNLSSNIPNGIYTVSIQIIDPKNYYPPLQLAIQGKQADGSYTLGTVAVGGNPSPTFPQQTPSPSIGQPTATPTQGGTPSDTPTPTPPCVGTPSDTPTPTSIPSLTLTPTPVVSSTPPPQPTGGNTPTPTPTGGSCKSTNTQTLGGLVDLFNIHTTTSSSQCKKDHDDEKKKKDTDTKAKQPVMKKRCDKDAGDPSYCKKRSIAQVVVDDITNGVADIVNPLTSFFGIYSTTPTGFIPCTSPPPQPTA